MRDVSKKIKQGIRDNKGTRSIASTKTRKKKVLITHMRNKLGNIAAPRKGTGNVSAEFYKELYSMNDGRKDKQESEARPENTCDHADDDVEDDEQERHIPEFTRKELMIAIDGLKRKLADSKGIKADDINGVDEETKTMRHEIFNLIMKQNSMAPNSRKTSYNHSDLQERRRDKSRE